MVSGARSDGTKGVLALVSGHGESTQAWTDVFRDFKARGLGKPWLMVVDGKPIIWTAVTQVRLGALGQRCWNDRTRNV